MDLQEGKGSEHTLRKCNEPNELTYESISSWLHLNRMFLRLVRLRESLSLVSEWCDLAF